MILPDYHIHTRYSPDSSMLHADAIEAALQAGVTDLCFTEHMDLGHHMESFNRVPDFEGMRTTIAALQLQYPNIRLHCGIEAGYIAETAGQTAQVLSAQAFDYVLLSTHCVDGIDCYLPEFKRGQDKLTAYRRYLETLLQSVTDLALLKHYDCIGHIGYIAKCRHFEDNAFPYELFPSLFDEILTAIVRNGKGLEINTSGLNRAGHMLPHPSILTRYHRLGGRIITIGSDAHKPAQVGAHIPQAIQILRACGFTEIACYRQRKPEFFPI